MENVSLPQQEDFDVGPETSLGILLDRALRKVSALRLNDFYMGCYLSEGDQQILLYFSDRLDEEQLENLVNSIEAPEFKLSFEETEEEGAGWKLQLIYDESASPEEFEVEVGGDVDVTVELTGDVEVGES